MRAGHNGTGARSCGSSLVLCGRGAGEGEVDLFQGRAVDVEVGQVKAAAERPVAEHLQVDQRALAVHDGQPSRPGPADRSRAASPAGSVKLMALVIWSRPPSVRGVPSATICPADRTVIRSARYSASSM